MAGMVVVGTINHGKGMSVTGIAKIKRLAKKKKIKKRMKGRRR